MKKVFLFAALALALTACGGNSSVKSASDGQPVREPVKPEALKGEWCWVGQDIPELILVLDTDEEGNLVVNDLYTYRAVSYRNPKVSFDGETLWIRKDVDENAYLELTLKPDGDDLKGRCLMVGIWKREFDEEITLRRDYFEYDQ